MSDLLKFAIFGVGGWLLYKHFTKQAVQATAQEMTSSLTDYQSAAGGLQVSRKPEVAQDGSLLYESLDPTPANPIPQFVAVTREYMLSVNDLAQQNFGKYSQQLVSKSAQGKPYLDPNVKVKLAKIFFFNRDTGKEVAAYELKKQADWQDSMKDALEDLFAHTFQDACKVNPRYDPWTNSFRSSGVICENIYPVTL